MSTNQPTNRQTDQQGEYRAICLFRKLENRKKAEICNLLNLMFQMDYLLVLRIRTRTNVEAVT